MSDRIEPIIIRQLMRDPEYGEKVLPYIEPSFFKERPERLVFEELKKYITKYSACPSNEQLIIAMDERGGFSEEDFGLGVEILKAITEEHCPADSRWLMDRTEKWIRKTMVEDFVIGGVIESVTQGKKPLPSPDEYAAAMGFSFTPVIGYDPFVDPQLLHVHMTSDKERFVFGAESLTRLTSGGVSRKTLNVVLAATNAGKSLFMCDLAANYMRQGRKVLYLTLEMSDKITAHRIIANLLDTELEQLRQVQPEAFQRAMAGIQERYQGHLVIHEYPASNASVGDFRRLFKELSQKLKFIPDVVFVDYLNLCAPSSSKKTNSGSYDAVGTVAKELRGLATEKDIVLWTATQTNRQGYKERPQLGYTSESYEINSTSDLILGLWRDEGSPDILNVELLKQRNGGCTGPRQIVLGVNTAKMKVYEVDPAEGVRKILTQRKPSGNAASIKERVAGKAPKYSLMEAEDVA
jgi:archaellum biogenesis ATPase FlaH